jgi:hypothetical protein
MTPPRATQSTTQVDLNSPADLPFTTPSPTRAEARDFITARSWSVVAATTGRIALKDIGERAASCVNDGIAEAAVDAPTGPFLTFATVVRAGSFLEFGNGDVGFRVGERVGGYGHEAHDAGNGCDGKETHFG